jgi:HAD superfamily hydrolase (TIGR01484 family)
VEHGGGWASEPTFPSRADDLTHRPQGDLDAIYGDDVAKLLAVHAHLEPEEFWRQVEAAVGHLVTTTWSSTFALVEMSVTGVTKASAVSSLARDLGISADEVVAFGDMPNDLPLLEWAGTSFAMANAHPTVLAMADHVAPANDEDGVAAVLNRLFDLSIG